MQRSVHLIVSHLSWLLLTVGILLSAQAASPATIVAWGANREGQTNVPKAALSGVVAVAAGGSHTVALKEDGSVLAWGNNRMGQASVPLAAHTGVKAIAAGATHTLALKADGSVVAWGGNQHGQTNAPADVQSGVKAIAAGSAHSVALKEDGSIVAWGKIFSDEDKGYVDVSVPEKARSGVVSIAAGSYHTVALKADGSVFAWGNNRSRQTDVPLAARSGVKAIAAGGRHTVALKEDGSVLAWGAGTADTGKDPDFGQSRVPEAARSGVEAIAAGERLTLALKKDGSMLAWGRNLFGVTDVRAEVRNRVLAIAAGAYHVVALVRSPASPLVPASSETDSAVVITGNPVRPAVPHTSHLIVKDGVALLKIPGFYTNTLAMVEAAIVSIATEGVRHVILDLRDNQGGVGSVAADVAGLFLGRKMPLWGFRRAGQTDVKIQFGTRDTAWSGGLLVLVNASTSSAGELLASAFQASGRAKVWGQTTRGRGHVYSVQRQPNGELKRSVSGEFLTARGEPIEGLGIQPDLAPDPDLPESELLAQAATLLKK